MRHQRETASEALYMAAAEPAGLGLPGGNRTHNLLLRRQLLYPVELRAEGAVPVAKKPGETGFFLD